MRTLVVALFVFSLPAYAGLMDYARGQLCNENGAYAQGMNDARADKPMSFSFVGICDDSVKDQVQKGYRDGYTAGLQSRQAQQPQTEVSVNIGGESAKRVYCEVHPFTETYSAWGASQLEAQVNVKSKCTKKYDEMFCKDFSCKTSE